VRRQCRTQAIRLQIPVGSFGKHVLGEHRLSIRAASLYLPRCKIHAASASRILEAVDQEP
jgi:hypothetical protein